MSKMSINKKKKTSERVTGTIEVDKPVELTDAQKKQKIRTQY